jgi:hypothetical protein
MSVMRHQFNTSQDLKKLLGQREAALESEKGEGYLFLSWYG